MILQGWHSWKTPHCVASVWMRLMPVPQPPELLYKTSKNASLLLRMAHCESDPCWMTIYTCSTIYDYLKVCAKKRKWIKRFPPQKQQGAPIKEKESKPTVLAKLMNIGNRDQIFHFCGSQDLPLAEVIYKSRKHFQELSCESPSLSLQQAFKNTHGKRLIEWLIKSKHSNQV